MQLVEHMRLPTSGARGVETFTIGDERYLGIPQLAEDILTDPADMNGGNSDVDAIIYKWVDDTFIEFQRLPSHGGEQICFNYIDNCPTLSIANIRSGKNPNFDMNCYVALYTWREGRFELAQQLPGYACKSAHIFNHQNDSFLACSEGVFLPNQDERIDTNSHLYLWSRAQFDPLQTLRTKWGYDITTFEIGDRLFLGIADNSAASVIYEWCNNELTPVQSFFSNGGGRGFCHFTINNEHYVAAANLLNDSALYQWNGKQFSPIQVFSNAGARHFHFLETRQACYLFRTNFITGTREEPTTQLESQIYIWEHNQFVESARYTTYGGTQSVSFSDSDQYYLAVSNSLAPDSRFKVDSVIYKILEAKSP
tara:strand:- start:6969 stop:8069 length:1101 start_codon:yes stop_codon:yes gene_type:complete